MEGHLKRHIDIDHELMIECFDADGASLQSCMRIVEKGVECRAKEVSLSALYHPFQRARHSVFDTLSLRETSLDCLTPLVIGCGDFGESEADFFVHCLWRTRNWA